jgi:hypothetical protein
MADPIKLNEMTTEELVDQFVRSRWIKTRRYVTTIMPHLIACLTR